MGTIYVDNHLVSRCKNKTCYSENENLIR